MSRTDVDRRTPESPSQAGPVAAGFDVTTATAEETAPLRRAVLRPHFTLEQMVSSDESPDATYLAARERAGDRAMLGCVRLEPVPCPWPAAVQSPSQAPWQLRAMATAPMVRGRGVGRRLVDAAVAHVTERGGDLIWCNARISAQGFYGRLGFDTVTGRFDLPEVAEAHVGMVRPV